MSHSASVLKVEHHVEDIAADGSIAAILNDSQGLIEQLKELRHFIASDKPAHVSRAIKNLKIQNDYFNQQTYKNERALNKSIKMFSSTLDHISKETPSYDDLFPFQKDGASSMLSLKEDSYKELKLDEKVVSIAHTEKVGNMELTTSKQKQRQLDKSKKFEIGKEQLELELAIVVDLLYQGQFETIISLAPHLNLNGLVKNGDVTPNTRQLITFVQTLLQYMDDFDKFNFLPILNWVNDHHHLVNENYQSFELDLILTYAKYKCLTNNYKLPPNFESSSPLLLTLNDKWYSEWIKMELLNDNINRFSLKKKYNAVQLKEIKLSISKLKTKFKHLYLTFSNEKEINLPSKPPLSTALKVAHISTNQFVDYHQMQKKFRKSFNIASEDNELPFEIELPNWVQSHSIFICPVSRTQCSDIDPPVYMPCGHMVNQSTLHKLAARSRMKCPYCPASFSSVDCNVCTIRDVI
ncbi:ubiquitin-protein ligase [Martiniozyma asiatica (nom. inval.)]|nr:ubiquitin-protein ligase [Martiniozyma asiatica]